jgi:hypothetical protein
VVLEADWYNTWLAAPAAILLAVGAVIKVVYVGAPVPFEVRYCPTEPGPANPVKPGAVW